MPVEVQHHVAGLDGNGRALCKVQRKVFEQTLDARLADNGGQDDLGAQRRFGARSAHTTAGRTGKDGAVGSVTLLLL